MRPRQVPLAAKVPIELHHALRRFQEAEGYPTLSDALRAALYEWLELREIDAAHATVESLARRLRRVERVAELTLVNVAAARAEVSDADPQAAADEAQRLLDDLDAHCPDSEGDSDGDGDSPEAA